MKKARFWIVLVAAMLLAGAVYLAYTRWFATPAVAEEPPLQTATVRSGDIVITASGSGALMPAAELDLGFRTTGTVAEVMVKVGDEVEAGQVLARLDDTSARLQLAQAEQTLLEAQTRLDVDRSAAEWALGGAQADYVEAAQTLTDPGSSDQLAQARVNLEAAQTSLASVQEWHTNAFDPARDWERNIDAERDAAAASLARAQGSYEVAQAQYNIALAGVQNSLAAAEGGIYDAQQELVGAPGSALQADQWAVYKAELAVESAQLALEATVLTAPISGIVTAVGADPGEAVGSSPVITLAALEAPLVRFYLEESDLSKISSDNPVNVILTVWPDETFTGAVIRVDPVMVTLDGTPAVQAWAALEIPDGAEVTILSGMSAEVEVIAGEARDTLLVPVQALREIGPGQYAVFVVDNSGELTMRPVRVGLMDFANAQILDGLERGDVVSTGTVETE